MKSECDLSPSRRLLQLTGLSFLMALLWALPGRALASPKDGSSASGEAETLKGELPAKQAHPSGPSPTESPEAKLQAFEASLHFSQGKVLLRGDLASLDVNSAYRYLPPEDANKVLLAWGNPPSPGVLGMIFPADKGPFDDGGWAVVIEYEEEGYVKDDDAAQLNFDSLLADMQKDTVEANAERVKEGYAEVTLKGWAEPPHYDAATHKLYWAKHLAFQGSSEDVVNYDIRVLGRRGVLVLQAVSSLELLPTLKASMPQVMSMVTFNDGSRYEDFQPGVDTVAAYGLGALVAGKLVAKAGLLKGLLAVLLAGKKFFVALLLPLFAWFKRRFGGEQSR